MFDNHDRWFRARDGGAPRGTWRAGWAAARFEALPTVRAGGSLLLLASVAFHLLLPALRRDVSVQHPELAPSQRP